MFGRVEGIEFGSNFLKVVVKEMRMNEIFNESIEDRGLRFVI